MRCAGPQVAELQQQIAELQQRDNARAGEVEALSEKLRGQVVRRQRWVGNRLRLDPRVRVLLADEALGGTWR